MRVWSFLLGGLIVWAAHFFTLYIVASLFPGEDAARWLAITATLVALAAAGGLLVLSLARMRREGTDDLQQWMGGFAAAGCGLALVAVVYQGLPAVLA
jgi:hypothetical protein